MFNMNFAWRYFFILIWIAYLMCSGVFLFSRGFLLSRVSKQDTNTCRKLSENSNEDYYLNEEIVQEIFKNVNVSSNLCLPKKSKVIILVVDALKYDFGIYNTNLINPLPYENKIKIFTELLENQSENSRLMKFRADPPTTTLQRLKGLTTGSLPTFIDIGSNFATPEINEDNIIDQIINNQLSAVFLGDSTWTNLYPKRFKRQYSYESFDIFDLNTVDNEILKHLPGELENNDWDVLIAHFLGVDHCGHKYGPLHSEMSRKLTEVDQIIRSVIEKMPNDTVLLVMGDHGMTISGDHGGESEDELNALLFAYSKSYKLIPNEYGSDNTTMQQIDLVPTLSAILGIPIPYSNLGLINFNLLPDIQISHMKRYEILLLHVWQNAKQIYNYFLNYSIENQRQFNFDEISKFENDFYILTQRVNTIYTEESFQNFILDLNQYLRNILLICHKIWIKFDATQMFHGLLITFLVIFSIFLLIQNSKNHELMKIFTTKICSLIYLMNIISGLIGYLYYKELSLNTEEHGIIIGTNLFSLVLIIFLIIQNWPNITMNWSQMKMKFNTILTRCIFLISISIYFSNSFIIEEPKILSYLLIGLLLIILYDLLIIISNNNSLEFLKPKFKIITFLKSQIIKLIILVGFGIILLRCAFILFKCREEQQQGSTCNNINTSNILLHNNYDIIKFNLIPLIVLILYTTLIRIYLRSCGNLTGYTINILLGRYGITIGTIFTGIRILLTNNKIKMIKLEYLDMMAWFIYSLFTIQLIIIIISPLMLYVLPKRRTNCTRISVTQYSHDSNNVIPEIFKKLKHIYNGGGGSSGSAYDDDNQHNNDIPIVYGLATVYSSILISFGVFLSFILIILLDSKASLGLFICITVAVVLLVIHSILRYRTANSLADCTQPTFTAIVAWLLLSQFCFFATSHQTTMSQIDWRAAFVGRSANYDNSNVLSAILVICNTFCGQIFFLTLFGLLSSETFSIYALFPALLRHNRKDKKNLNSNDFRETNIQQKKDESSIIPDFDITRGELILYENERQFIGSIFKLACQFFMLQGIKIFCAMMACTIHCRHLMVWKIFAPRFIYEGLSTYISLLAIIFGYLIIIRVHWSVNNLINAINKTK